MSESARIQVTIPVFVPVFICIGCSARAAAVIQATQIHRQVVNKLGTVDFIKGIPEDAQTAVNYSAPDGWQLIKIPGRPRHFDTDGYCCVNCVRIIQAVVDAALTTAQIAIGVNKLNVQNALTPAPVHDPRQAIIPHEYTTTVVNAPPNTVICDICGLLEKQCRETQAALTATTKG